MSQAAHTRILEAGVIEALRQGEATTNEVALRMGVVFAGGKSRLAQRLQSMARRKLGVRKVGERILGAGKLRRRNMVWALAPK